MRSRSWLIIYWQSFCSSCKHVTLHNYNIIKIPVGPAPNTPLKLLFILQKYTVKFVNYTAVFINWQYRHISKQFTRLSYKNSNRKTRLFYLDSVDFKDNFGRLFSSVLQQKHGGSKLMLSKIIWTRFREFSRDLFHESFRVFTLTTVSSVYIWSTICSEFWGCSK